MINMKDESRFNWPRWGQQHIPLTYDENIL